MSDNSKKSKRIAKNTIVLYFRMIFLMLVSLYTSRVILDALGVFDYGIYNVVGGFVSMFALISAALTSACSRFLNYEMGKGDMARQNVVFSTAVTIQWALAIIVFVFAEAIGVWYVNNVMVLPDERLTAANWCFQFSVFNFCMNLITVPYNASIVAHEKMKAFAYVSIYQGLATLGVSFLVYYDPFDRLVFYAFMLMIIQFTVRYAYQYYCRKHFEECKYRRVFDKPLLRNMLSYSVWHLVGNGAAVLKNHGVNIVLNLFHGPAVNAARGLANQVDNAVNQFVGNFMMAMNPQITQSYSRGDHRYMYSLVYKGSRFSFYIILLFALPLMVNAHFVLDLWLKEIPDYTVAFTQLSLVTMLIASLSKTLMTAQNATGNVRNYQLVVGIVNLLNLPLSYLFLYLGYSPIVVVFVAIFVEILAFFIRIYMLPLTLPDFKATDYLFKVGGQCLLVTFLASPIPLLFNWFIPETLLSVFANILLSLICTSIAILFVGCDSQERQFVFLKIKELKKKIIKA